MFYYVKCGNFFAIYVELSKDFGLKPFFKLDTCNNETIIDMPFMRSIITPHKRLIQENTYNKDEQEYRKNSTTATRVSKS